MIAARVGVVAPDIEQSAAYIAGWLEALRSDKKLIVIAAGRAQKAADWILGTQDDNGEHRARRSGYRRPPPQEV